MKATATAKPARKAPPVRLAPDLSLLVEHPGDMQTLVEGFKRLDACRSKITPAGSIKAQREAVRYRHAWSLCPRCQRQPGLVSP